MSLLLQRHRLRPGRQLGFSYESSAGEIALGSDSFNRADGAAGSLDNAIGGIGPARSWLVESGVWAIASNELQCTSAGNILVNLGVTTCRIRAQYRSASTVSILGHYVDASNHWRVLLEAGRLEIFELTAGVATSRGQAAISVSVGDYWEAIFGPGYITAFHPRTGATKTYSSTAHATNTVYGLRSATANANFDNFLATSPAAGYTPTLVFDEQWTTADAAPIASPRTAEPGPGGWVLTGTEASIAGGKYVGTNASATQGALSNLSFAREAGLAMVCRNVSIPSTPSANAFVLGFRSAATLSSALEAGIICSNADMKANVLGGGSARMIPIPTIGVDYDFAFVIRPAGCYLFWKLSASVNWTLGQFIDQGTAATLTPEIYHSTSAINVGRVQIWRGVEISRAFYCPSGPVGVITLPSADFIAKMRCGGVADQGFKFRIQDATNYWRVVRTATNTLKVIKRIAGVDSADSVSLAITTAALGQITLQAIGSVIRCWHRADGNVTWTSQATAAGLTGATEFQTATGMEIIDEANYTEFEVLNASHSLAI